MNGNFQIENGILIKYCGPEDVEELHVPDGVVSISQLAFDSIKKSLRVITMPDSLREISDNVFANFLSLEKVRLSDNTTTIGDNCFYNCCRLSEIIHVEGIVWIGSFAFSKTKIEKIALPNVENIGISAFESCTNLQTAVLSEKLKIVPYKCFSYCTSLKNLQLPEGINEIHGEAFMNTPIPQITIPSSVYKIEIISQNNNSSFSPSTKITISANNQYYEILDNHITEQKYHEDGGLYTVMKEYDKCGRCKVVYDASTGEKYYLKKICYSQDKMSSFLEICDAYSFCIYEQEIEGNDDLNLETEISYKEYNKNLTITDAVIKDDKVIGFICDNKLLQIETPLCVPVKTETPYISLSYYRYKYSKQTYTLVLNK